jgi:hypothetical protein
MKLKRIEYSTALLAKEVGFNLPDYWVYGIKRDNTADLCKISDKVTNESLSRSKICHGGYYYDKISVTAPSQALLQQWLRVKHNIIIYVEYDFDYTKTNYRGVIRLLNKEGIPQYVFTLEYSSYTSGIQKVETVSTNYKYTDKDYTTYEEALEEALVIGLNLLKL